MWLKKKSVVLVILAASLAGCVNQKEEVMHYRKVLHSKPATSMAQLIIPRQLTLSAALKLANDNNEQLAIAGENYLQAMIAKDKAFSTFMPTVGVSAQDFQMHEFNTSGMPPGVSQFFQTHYFNVPLQTQLNVNVLKDARYSKAVTYAIMPACCRKELYMIAWALCKAEEKYCSGDSRGISGRLRQSKRGSHALSQGTAQQTRDQHGTTDYSTATHAGGGVETGQ